MEGFEWNKLTLTGKREDEEALSAILSLLDDGSLMIESYEELQVNESYGEFLDEELKALDRDSTRVSVFLPAERSVSEAAAFLRERLQSASLSAEISVEGLKEEDFAENWKKYYHPIPFGRLTVVPAWEDYDERVGEKILRIDPGTAFGTATHESTYMMIEFLCEEIKGGERVLDLGCGSGILSLAAKKLGADFCAAYDLDPEAVKVTKKNIEESGEENMIAGVSNLLQSVDQSAPYDFLCANIVSDILILLAPDAADVLKKGGLIAVSGILSDRADEVRERFCKNNFTFVSEKRQNDWRAMLFRRS